MHAAIFLLSLLVVTAPAAAERMSHGIFLRWGVFSEGAPKRCFAVTRPEVPRVRFGPYASVSFGDGGAGEGQAYFRLSRPPRQGSSVLLRIGDQPFQLAARGADAWARDAQANAAIVAAMRRGGVMTVDTYTSGGRVRDRYHLRGAASAIDAAAVACARP